MPDDLRYSDSHEWCRLEGDLATIGITDHAQDQLGDVVYLELPAAGTAVAAGVSFGSIDSIKATSQLIAPVSGEVVETNEQLDAAPDLVNKDPYGAGWLLRIRLTDSAEVEGLLDQAAYEALCLSEGQ